MMTIVTKDCMLVMLTIVTIDMQDSDLQPNALIPTGQVDLVTSTSPITIETLPIQPFPLPPNLRLPVSPTHPISPTPHLPHLPHPTAYLPASPPPLSSPTSPPPATPNDPEPVYLLVIGSRRGITAIVHSLHIKQFAHIHEWSPYQNHSSGRLLRILTRYV